MNKTLKDISFNEFLELISGIATIKKHTILINYEDEIIGTIKQLKNISDQTKSIEVKRFIHKFIEDKTIEFSEIDIVNYLHGTTNNFQRESIKLGLFELDVFENIVFNEVVNDLTTSEYQKNQWIIPTFEKINPKTNKTQVCVNYREMKNKLFPFVGFQLEFVKQFLKGKLNSEIKDNTIKPPFKDAETKPIDKLNTPVINPFKDKQTAELFEYIIDNWDYPKNQKYADIWNGIEFSENYKAPYQNEYQKYIIKRFGYTGRFQYSYTKDPNNRDHQRLLELIENFSKK